MTCKDWLKKYLSDGEPHNVENIRADRIKADFTMSEVKAAKKEIGAITFDDRAIQQENVPFNWFWQLPESEGGKK